MCHDVFGDVFTPEWVKANVERTNNIYGGLNYQGSRVIFVNGNLDPWFARYFKIPHF